MLIHFVANDEREARSFDIIARGVPPIDNECDDKLRAMLLKIRNSILIQEREFSNLSDLNVENEQATVANSDHNNKTMHIRCHFSNLQ